jgi:hypothetical protein
LYGGEQIAGWQEKAAQYPDGLARAMVRAHLRFYPRWLLEGMIAGRGDLLWLHEVLIQEQRKILGVLLGLNQIYHHGELKRLDRLVERMVIAPAHLSARLRQILQAEPLAAIDQIQALIEETLDLIDRHLPEVETSEARQPSRFGVELTSWKRG